MSQDFYLTLPCFEGTLFQLLKQIQEEEIALTDFPISEVTSFGISQMSNETFFVNGPDFIYSIALLLTWKTRKLLPKEEQLLENLEETWKPQIMEQSQFKEIVNDLIELEQKRLPHFSRNIFFVNESKETDLKELEIEELSFLFQKIMEKWIPLEMKIEDEFDVSSQMDQILQEIKRNSLHFEELFSLQKSKEELIAKFLALLELIKEQKIRVYSEAQKFIISLW